MHLSAQFDRLVHSVKNNSCNCLNNHVRFWLPAVLIKPIIQTKSMNLFAAICGIIGSACYLAFFIGGRRDSDGQGTNMS